MRARRIGPFVWLREDLSIRRAMAQLLALDRTDADYDSENALAERECASLDADTDPEPGAFYGLTPSDTDTEPTHA